MHVIRALGMVLVAAIFTIAGPRALGQLVQVASVICVEGATSDAVTAAGGATGSAIRNGSAIAAASTAPHITAGGTGCQEAGTTISPTGAPTRHPAVDEGLSVEACLPAQAAANGLTTPASTPVAVVGRATANSSLCAGADGTAKVDRNGASVSTSPRTTGCLDAETVDSGSAAGVTLPPNGAGVGLGSCPPAAPRPATPSPKPTDRPAPSASDLVSLVVCGVVDDVVVPTASRTGSLVVGGLERPVASGTSVPSGLEGSLQRLALTTDASGTIVAVRRLLPGACTAGAPGTPSPSPTSRPSATPTGRPAASSAPGSGEPGQGGNPVGSPTASSRPTPASPSADASAVVDRPDESVPSGPSSGAGTSDNGTSGSGAGADGNEVCPAAFDPAAAASIGPAAAIVPNRDPNLLQLAAIVIIGLEVSRLIAGPVRRRIRRDGADDARPFSPDGSSR